MTEQEWVELGRRAVACRGWRWLPGMLARYERDAWCRATEANSLGLPPRTKPPNSRRAWPDFRDPATVGCLLALVREAWGPHAGADSTPCTHQTLDGAWGVGSWVSRTFAAINLPTYPTEAAALVAALEAAP